MAKHSLICIIYNPRSTGKSQRLAEKLRADIKSALPKARVSVLATKRAGHAEELAFDCARQNNDPLIISVSGDGGYHEVINGVLRAKAAGFPAVTGLLPAGNANDHYSSLHHTDLLRQIVAGTVRKIDAMEFSATQNGKPYTRFAHSYIGFGITPYIGQRLTKTRMNRLREMWIPLAVFKTYKPVSLSIAGETGKFYSLTLSTIDRMGRVLSFGPATSVDDGKFEIHSLQYRFKSLVLLSVLKAMIGSVVVHRSAERFELRTVDKTLVQLDGEVVSLDAGSLVSVECRKQTLRCVI